ncbi:MAG: flagellar hook-length control protein FliK [Halopseudomonas sp.]|uniref:flagellar hook-length control protein FliK n=1 Tax=Halopseudomonas sp. TaxID=2901191 RepID=UPI003001DF68
MPIGQNMMTLMSVELPRDQLAGVASGKAESGKAEGFGAFSSILAAQQPAELRAMLNQLSHPQGEDTDQDAAAADFAADGNSLPLEIRDWLQKLANLESPAPMDSAQITDTQPATETAEGESQEAMDLLANLSTQWQQWLAQLPQQEVTAASGTTASSPAGVADALTELSAADAEKLLQQLAAAQAGAGLPGDKVLPATGLAQGALSLPEMLAQLRSAIAGSATSEAGSSAATAATDDEAEVATHGKTGASVADDKLLMARQANPADQAQATQRVATLAAAMDPQGVFAARLAEQKAQDTAKPGSTTIDALDAQSGTAASTGAAPNALTQRPVAAATQALAVPFGQSGWSESVVNKVMWMSSQNLKSVEIQLDPAELGPLEIKIQTRGLEHQVQFVSQNPAVRDALEAQMHRLRDSFAQQGLDQLDVSVSDGGQGQQSGSEARGSFAQTEDGAGRAGNGRGGVAAAGEDELPMAAAQNIVANNRLVDYYA